jgi:two-component system NtrC family sensor kinase
VTGVLIVDDSLTVRMDLDEAFAAAGFQPTLCADAAAARAALASRRFSLAVLDVVLPDGDGLEILVEMKSSPEHAGTPVVLLSSEAEVRDRVRGLRTGADDYVGKPYDASHVVARARELVQRGEARDGDGRRAPVLVVDDSVTAREDLRAALGGAGLDVVTASSGEEGLRLAAARHPSAVVVDGLMPGMGGAAFVRQIRGDAALRSTPCILLTASGALHELEALDSGADAYLRKEGGNALVVARLQALLRASNPVSAVGATAMLAPKRALAIGAGAALRQLAGSLRADGHDVACATSAAEALELIAVDRVDAIVVDATRSLEEALATCRRLRAEPAGRAVPLLVAGGDAGEAELVRALDAGAEDLVPAAAGGEVLRARLRAQLRRKQLDDESRAREAYARSAAILETISDAFFAVDRSWRLVYANHELERILGAPRAALLGETLWDRCAAFSDGFERELRRAADEGAPVSFETQRDERWLEVRAFPHESGLSAHLRDVTERHRADEVQRYLMSIVGHDLRTPLTAVAVSAGLVLRDRELPDRHRRALERVEGGVARMSRLISDLLDYSRTRLGEGLPLQRRPAELDALCREALDDVRAVHPERTVEYRASGGGAGEWDAGRVGQVLLNLLTNACRYSPADSPISLTWEGSADEVVIAVQNGGPPIEASLLGRVFEPFRRGSQSAMAPRGLGLGLYIVREVVRAHGGSVAVESEDGAGTTFTVTLPRGVGP